MARVGFHASHEQFPPGELLRLVQRAESAGFQCAMCSDHFHPWSRAQGNSGHAWTWLGAAMAATKFPFGVVNAPVGRYHPAVIAQAAATLADMHGDRFWLAAGSGEAINECITGQRWPAKDVRNRRLREAVEVMRALWRGEEVTHHGEFTVERARLYSLPPRPLPVIAAALSPETARWAGNWADDLITISQPREKLRAVLDAFRQGGGHGGRRARGRARAVADQPVREHRVRGPAHAGTVRSGGNVRPRGGPRTDRAHLRRPVAAPRLAPRRPGDGRRPVAAA